ncbi:MAG: hypothetical protein QG663_228, partial [Thermodesulfobacteriota bacterium]|nr:hypothetical protein [Thermodesulfobacteriota bacterium]
DNDREIPKLGGVARSIRAACSLGLNFIMFDQTMSDKR